MATMILKLCWGWGVFTCCNCCCKACLKIFDYGKAEPASGSRVRQEIKLKKGISQEIAKQITKLIRDEFKKIQGSSI